MSYKWEPLSWLDRICIVCGKPVKVSYSEGSLAVLARVGGRRRRLPIKRELRVKSEHGGKSRCRTLYAIELINESASTATVINRVVDNGNSICCRDKRDLKQRRMRLTKDGMLVKANTGETP